ncbi:MAG: UDP-N-acetylmuramate dehydrogenase [Firmicutes bacterium]|nr:UDP-N-acetylmuramate dehydrogenase [Bacillota bacterium]
MDIEQQFHRNIPLSQFTTFRIGGPADYFVRARSVKTLRNALQHAASENLPVLVIGGGSNLLINDRGIRGMVVKNELKGIKYKGNQLTVRSGEKVSGLVDFARKNGMAGIEFMAGIPGSAGGAVFGNAGAYGKAIGDLVKSAVLMKSDGSEVFEVTPDYFGFTYRRSRLRDTRDVLISVTIELAQGSPEAIGREIDQIKAERASKHPDEKWGCAGSYFKNIDPQNPGERRIPAGMLLEKVGAKSMKEGNAMVFPKHANFLTNPGNATCEEILKLAETLKTLVKQEFAIELEEEVLFINEIPE